MKTNRRQFLQTTATTLLALGVWPTQAAGLLAPFRFDPSQDIIPAPDDPAQWPAFRDALARWRDQIRTGLKYNDVLYRRPDLKWSASNYSCGFVMVWDEQFYDYRSGRYTVDDFLNEGEQEFGGYDS